MSAASISDTRIKRVGTREDVYKGLATRTAGGLKRDDIIPKQFGTKTLYISKKLSDRMRENFNVIRSNNPNYFKRQAKKTMVASQSQSIQENQAIQSSQFSQSSKPNEKVDGIEKRKMIKPHGKTQKLSFKIHDNTVKNVYYKELKGMDIQELKEELKREESEEDLGLNTEENKSREPRREFSIEEMPDISLADLS
jgi:hypothetical protein